MLFIGDDWAETSHDIEIQSDEGRVLARRKLHDGVDGIEQLHALVADAGVSDPADVAVGIERGHGLWVSALQASGYVVYPVNPFSVSRYRDRHSTSGAKSDTGDAKILADLVRTDRHNHRPLSAESEEVKALRVLTRSHQSLIWARQQHANALRSALLEYYSTSLKAFPSKKDLVSADALAVLGRAPTPAQGQALSVSQLKAVLRSGGRQRNLQARAEAIQQALRSRQLPATALIADAFGVTVTTQTAVIRTLNEQISRLAAEIAAAFNQHPDADIISSLPGLGPTLGARMLAESGDDPNRFSNAKARRNYSGTSPITVASGTKKSVFARHHGNNHIRDTALQWAVRSLPWSPEANACYQRKLAQTGDHRIAIRAVANKWVGILHGCLKTRTGYDPAIAWPALVQDRQAA